ncbi:MAG: hypothetical protein IIY49_05135 [Eubacterium sp.]|nr:hypothetical protein [Eubacterium sp.]
MQIKKFVTGILLAALIITASKTTEGMTHFYAQSGSDWSEVWTEANTTKNRKTETTDYGLKKGKYVKKVEVFLREGDTYLHKETDDGFVRVSKGNNILYTAYGWWSWIYR